MTSIIFFVNGKVSVVRTINVNGKDKDRKSKFVIDELEEMDSFGEF